MVSDVVCWFFRYASHLTLFVHATECPNDITYASKAGDTCLHLVMEVPLAVTNGPAEYEVKDVMKNKFHRATNLEGRLYGAIQTANANTAFVGVGKPGAGRG